VEGIDFSVGPPNKSQTRVLPLHDILGHYLHVVLHLLPASCHGEFLSFPAILHTCWEMDDLGPIIIWFFKSPALMAASSYSSIASLLPAKVTIFPFLLESKLHAFVLGRDNWI